MVMIFHVWSGSYGESRRTRGRTGGKTRGEQEKELPRSYNHRTSDAWRVSQPEGPQPMKSTATGCLTVSENPAPPQPSQNAGRPTSTGRPDPREPPDVRYPSDDRRLSVRRVSGRGPCIPHLPLHGPRLYILLHLLLVRVSKGLSHFVRELCSSIRIYSIERDRSLFGEDPPWIQDPFMG